MLGVYEVCVRLLIFEFSVIVLVMLIDVLVFEVYEDFVRVDDCFERVEVEFFG